MPQFLEVRYDRRVRTSLSVFWVLVYIFVNLTSVLYLGALALNTIMDVPMWYGIVGLALFSALYSIYGGLKAVAWTDVFQVVFLIGGGLVTTYMALDALGAGNGVFHGFGELLRQAPDKFHMILPKNHPSYGELPGLGVLLGGLWVANLSYWGCNQYIIQRALAAKSIREAQRGLAFAGYLKIFIPLIVVVPGIAAYVLGADVGKPDEAYPWLLNNYVFTGMRGLAFAALIAAVVSSLSSMINSTATIFTMDIYKPYFKQEASETHLVGVGRMVSGVALLIAIGIAPQLANFEQVFQFIQEFTGFITPGVLAIFALGLFWKKATPNAALIAAAATIPLSAGFKWFTPNMPFLDRMGYVFVVLIGIMVIVSYLQGRGCDHPKRIDFSGGLFKTGMRFNIAALGIMIILTALYALFW